MDKDIGKRKDQDKTLTPRKLEDKTMNMFSPSYEYGKWKPSYEYGKWKPIRMKPAFMFTEEPELKDESFMYFPLPHNDFHRAHEKFHNFFSKKFLPPPPKKRYHRRFFQLPHPTFLHTKFKF